MYKVEELLKLEGGKYSIKLWNVFFKDKGQVYCDAYLTEIDSNWTIMLNGNGNKILLSKAQIEYLISKMERVDLLRYGREKVDEYFGLANGSGIKKGYHYYKLLFQYQTHFDNGTAKKYPFSFFVKTYDNHYRVDLDDMLLTLYKFKDILEKMIIGRGAVKIESIYDIDNKAMLYERESYSSSNSHTQSDNNSDDLSNSNEINIDDKDKKLLELGEIEVTVGKNAGKKLKELNKKDLEWSATKAYDEDLNKVATDYLRLMF